MRADVRWVRVTRKEPMTLRQTLQSAPTKTKELIERLSNTSNQAVKTRESLFAELSDELARYVELEEEHLLPLLRKHPDTKALAADAVKGNKELRTRLADLTASPKNDDAFLAKLAELNNGFQQHVRDERKELLPAVLKALSDEEAQEVAGKIQDGIADAEKAKREAKREEREQAKREEEAAEQAAEAQRAAVRAQKAAERNARETMDRTADTIQRGASAAVEGVRHVTVNMAEQAQQATSAAREAIAIYSGSAHQTGDDLRAVIESSNIALKALSEIPSAWMDWASRMARANAQASQQLLECRTIKQLAETQRNIVSNGVREWMEGSTQVLQIVQRTSKQALRPLDSRLGEAA